MPVRIVWHLETVGDPSREVLKQDRSIRSSITATDRLQRKLATTAQNTGRAQSKASQLATTGLSKEGRAARTTASDVARLNRAQAEAVRAGSGIAARARSIADGYRTQARAARELSAAEKVRARAQSVGKNVAGGGAGMTRAMQGGLAAAAGGGIAAKGVSIFAGFEQQMSRVQAVSGATGGDLERLTKMAERLGARTSFSAREAADGMYQLSTAGFKTKEVMRALPGTLDLAAASGTDLASAAELQASTLRGFGLRAGEAGRVADVLATTVNRSAVEMSDLGESLKYVAPVARATGQSMEDMLAAIGLMGNVGVKGSQAGTTLRTALVRLTDPTEKAQGALGKLGLEAKDLQGPKGLLPMPEILGKIVRGAQGMDKSTRNAALSSIFGREALSGMVAMVDKGPAAYRRNVKALSDVEGTAKQTAKTMRGNVAGAWDEFTGSLETGAITLVRRFSPAMQNGLKDAAKLTNTLAAGGAAFLGGLAGEKGGGGRGARVVAGAGGRRELVGGRGGDEPSRMQKIGGQVAGVARTIGTAAMSAGRQLLDAFKPAQPFLANVLLPLLKGIGKGILGSVVGAFKVLVVGIRVLSTALGWIGEKAKPLRGVFEGIGVVIGWLFTGPILKGIGLLGKLGGVFRLVGAAAKLLNAPVRIVGAAVGGLTRLVGSAVSRIPSLMGRLPGAIKKALAPIAVNIYSAFRGGVDRAFSVIRGAGGTIFKLGKGLVSKLVDGLKGIGGAVRSAFGSGLAFAGDIGRALADWLNRSTPLGDKVNLPSPLPDFTLPALRGGGRVGRYQGGGRVPILAAGGELLLDRGRGSIIPGDPSSDSTLVMARPGSQVFTASGQAMLAGGASPAAALAAQMPHFAGGGRVTPGRYLSTAYGPPWNALNGTGVTATGVNLKPARHAYGVAVDPRRIGLGSKVYAWPNPFGYSGAFTAFDTGGAIKGNRLDFYDWRGRQSQNRWGRRNVVVHSRAFKRKGAQEFTSGGPAAAPRVSILGASARRSGLIGDAWTQGFAFGREGGTRGVIRREGSPIVAAIREATRASSAAGNLSSRHQRDSSSSSRSSSRGFKLGGGWAGTEGLVRHAIRGLGRATFKRSYNTGSGRSDHWSAVRNAFAADLGVSSERQGDRLFSTLRGRLGVSAREGSWNVFPNRPIKGVRSQLLWHAPDGTHKDHVHLGIRRMRRGGLVGYRNGGGVAPNMEQKTVNLRAFAPGAGRGLNRGASKALSMVGGSLDALDRLLGQATLTRVAALRAAILRRIRAGGPEPVIKRLQAMLSTVDFEVGRRVGRIVAGVTNRSARIGRAQTRLEQGQRRAGVDPSSSEGLAQAAQFADDRLIPGAQRNVSDLKVAIAKAKKRGDRGTVRELTDQLVSAQGELDEAITVQVERRRDIARLAAEKIASDAAEGVSVAQHGSTLATSGLRRLELEQRLAGTFEGGGQARADFIKTQVIPRLEQEVTALRDQLRVANEQGDKTLARQIAEEIDSKQGDVLQATLDATEQVATNTEELREFTGSLATEYNGQPTTDNLRDFALGA